MTPIDSPAVSVTTASLTVDAHTTADASSMKLMIVVVTVVKVLMIIESGVR